MPNIFHLARRVTERINPVGGDILDHSVSRTPSFDEARRTEPELGIVGKALPKLPSEVSEDNERPTTPLLPTERRSNSRKRGWGEEWVYVKEKTAVERVSAANSDSAVSLTYDSSEGYISSSDRSSQVSFSRVSVTRPSGVARRVARPRIITPSSSISNISRRSPLSMVRYV